MTNSEVEVFIQSWCDLYPADVMFRGNRIKSKAKDCVKKMQLFCKANPNYTKEIIFAATKQYLEERKAEKYAFTKRATYFISKQGEPSLLEEYCDRIIEKIPAQIEYEEEPYNDINNFI